MSAQSRNLTDPSRVFEGGDLEAGLRAPEFDMLVVPEDFGPVEVVVDDYKVKRYAFALDAFSEIALHGAAEGRRIAQAGILANDLLQLFTLKYAPSQVVGLHTEEELWFERPIEVGTRVSLSGRYVEKYELRGQGYVVMEARALDERGRVCIRHRGVEIMRTAPAEVAGRGSAGDSAKRRVSGEFDRSLPLIEKVTPLTPAGSGLSPVRKEISAEQMAVFSRVGEYVSNIHNDLRTARAAGLAAPIVQGQQLVCLLAERLLEAFGDSWLSSGYLHVKFLKPVEALDTVELGGVVTAIRADADGTHADLDVWVGSSGARLNAIGWASCRVGIAENDDSNVVRG